MVNNKYFTIEEIAKELGISKQTIIRYEGRGIFPKPKRHPINHWRQYSPKDIKNLKKILGII
jgi:DNA-binding transcriptional MerR regulator